jgi:hypothetical protein
MIICRGKSYSIATSSTTNITLSHLGMNLSLHFEKAESGLMKNWLKIKFLGYYGSRHDENAYKVTVIRTIKGKKLKLSLCLIKDYAMTTYEGVAV